MAQYIVIFKAQIRQLDPLYFETAQRLRDKALHEYGCLNFEAISESHQEIALSYWCSLTDIQAWQQDAEHLIAQQLGKSQWYEHFSVEICEVLRRYSAPTN
jgi:heme-degrading monooxygenase HmoA